MNYAGMTDLELHGRLKDNDRSAWDYVLTVLAEQEKRSAVNNAKRRDWNTEIWAQLSDLYYHMMAKGKINNYMGFGSLIGWFRLYIRGYLHEEEPGKGIVSIDEPQLGNEKNLSETLSDEGECRPYGGGDLQIMKNEDWALAQQCFRNVWRGNGIQAYVMILKLRFGMSSAEIKERLGISSEANVDQLFSRGVKRMREERAKYEH